MADPTLGGWARLVSKLPSFRGIANWFYVSAHWSHISADFELYRQQIKDREQWSERALAQQSELHHLAMERSHAELLAWRDLTDKIVEQRDLTVSLAQRAVEGLDQAKRIIEQRDNAMVDCTILLAVLLMREEPAHRALLTQRLTPHTRAAIDFVIGDIDGRIARGEVSDPSRPPTP
jgi:hypothetical protein